MKNNELQYEVLHPWPDVDPITARGISPRIDDLANKIIGTFASSYKVTSRPILNVVEQRLKEKYPSIRFSQFDHGFNMEVTATDEKAKFEQWVKGVDAVVAAVGDWGSCTKYLVYNTILAEDSKKPAVAICSRGFGTDAKSAASGKGMPGVRVVLEDVAPECTVEEEIEAGINPVMGDIITALTKPLTAEEKSPQPKEVEKLPRVVFKGNLEEVNRFFYKRGWGDGLPIVPPTEEAVKEMLTGTDLPADHVVGKIIPRLGKATVEKIAVNAVMAGALPTYMPLLITAVQAILDPKAHFGSWQVSTGSWAPCWIINGPIRKDLHINSGTGALSPGNVANAAIGRAMSLIIKNIGGARKGVEDMGVLGNPGKYTMVIAENEEDSPWEPLHVQQGLNKDDNAVTVFFPNCFAQIWPYSSDDNGILRGFTSNIIPGRKGPTCLTVLPTHAKTLADKGWTKGEIAAHISQFARVQLNRDPGIYGPLLILPPKEYLPTYPEDTMQILPIADWIRIIVAGGPGNFMGIFQGGYDFPGLSWTTRKVELPQNWDKLVNKYRNIVPEYVRY